VLAPILNKIKNGVDGADGADKKLGGENSGSGHIAVQIEPARRVKVRETDLNHNVDYFAEMKVLAAS